MALNNTTVDFYVSGYAPNKLYKELNAPIKTCSCYVKEPCVVEAPIIVINYDQDLKVANYAYIPEFNRYYFIQDRTLSPGSKIELQLKVDVLMTYWADIRNLEIILERVGDRNLEDSYIQDSLNVPKQYTESFILEFPWDFNGSASDAPIYILAK